MNTSTNTEKIGRNDPCPCGSGKKYKKCCLVNKEEREAEAKRRSDLEWNDWFAKDVQVGKDNLAAIGESTPVDEPMPINTHAFRPSSLAAVMAIASAMSIYPSSYYR